MDVWSFADSGLDKYAGNKGSVSNMYLTQKVPLDRTVTC